MTNILMVPIHLDALFVNNDKSGIEPMADFTRLPYFNGQRDVNPNIANISEEIVSQPFQNKNFNLQSGIRLHWALPDALSKTIAISNQPTGSAFPSVPNRWLIERTGGGLPLQKWIVESDYLYPWEPFRKDTVSSVNILYSADLFSGGNPEAIAHLIDSLNNSSPLSKFIKGKFSKSTLDLLKSYSSGTLSDELQAALIWELNQILQHSSLYDQKRFSKIALSQKTKQLINSNPKGENLVCLNRLLLEAAYPECKGIGHQPFRYLGRKMTFEDWQKQRHQTVPYVERLDPLTAVGYGEPTFAAFYPNCHSVFGFDDGDIRVLPHSATKLQYTVIGWYDRDDQDYFRSFVKHTQNISPNQKADVLTAIQAEFQWTTEVPSGQSIPEQMLCYAQITFEPTSDINNANKASATEIAIGNTGMEALSAYLSHKIISSPESADKLIIEDQLEALHLLTNLEDRQVDIGAKFAEARHEKGFNAVPAGTLWAIRYETETGKDDKTDAQTREEVSLPKEIANSLNQLNVQQQEYDRALDEIESLRHRLFSDWYKYMLCSYPPDDSRDDYPDIDEVKDYIEVKGIAPLSEKLTKTGELKLAFDKQRTMLKAEASSSDSIAGKLAEKINNLISQIDHNLNQNQSKSSNSLKNRYILKPISAPRYWQPNEPVILIAGEAAKYTQRHGSDGRLRNDNLLECQIYYDSENKQENKTVSDFITNDTKKIFLEIDKIKTTGKNSIAFSIWKQQPWHPFLLEWQVEVLPVKYQNNLHSETRDYNQDFIHSNYTLPENSPDLSAKTTEILRAANIYSGSCIVTPHASFKMKEQIEAYLHHKKVFGDKSVMDAYFSEHQLTNSKNSYLNDSRNIETVKTWYEGKYLSHNSRLVTKEKDPNYTILRVCQELQTVNCFSQVLGGFNAGLLMHKQTMQLQINDPIGFDDYKGFTEKVRQAVCDRLRVAPIPFNDFNPIRTGVMRILRLRLINTFGQFKDLDTQGLIVTEKMLPASNYNLPNTRNWVFLPPRLVQPSRLNFRWLSADSGEQEANNPVTTPICGWLLPNNLDKSLMVYDGSGNALGSVNQQAKWNSAPGTDIVVQSDEISNLYLRKIVERLTIQTNDTGVIIQRKQDFIRNFISVINTALANIEPESFAQHQELALLMGSPIAIVRTSLNLELQGLPNIHHGWNEFRQDLQRQERDTDEVTCVKFPMRIGEYQQLNDGVIGYWQENQDGSLSNAFYAPQSDHSQDQQIITHPSDKLIFWQALADAPQNFTLLIEPRGKVHITSGILPTKFIDLPPSYYTEALKNIEITFLTAPILTEAYKIKLPLPQEVGYAWSWLQKERLTWQEVSTVGILRKEVILSAFDHGEEVWSRLLEKGWIEKPDLDKAWVVAKDKRTHSDLGEDMKDKKLKIEDILERTYIGAVNPKAIFGDQQEIREGWLKLRQI